MPESRRISLKRYRTLKIQSNYTKRFFDHAIMKNSAKDEKKPLTIQRTGKTLTNNWSFVYSGIFIHSKSIQLQQLLF